MISSGKIGIQIRASAFGSLDSAGSCFILADYNGFRGGYNLLKLLSRIPAVLSVPGFPVRKPGINASTFSLCPLCLCVRYRSEIVASPKTVIISILVTQNNFAAKEGTKMTSHRITLELPENIYIRLQHAARATKQSLNDMLIRAIQTGSPPG